MSTRSDDEVIQNLRMTFHKLQDLLDEAWRARLDIGVKVNRSVNHGETTTDHLSLEYSIKKNILP